MTKKPVFIYVGANTNNFLKVEVKSLLRNVYAHNILHVCEMDLTSHTEVRLRVSYNLHDSCTIL